MPDDATTASSPTGDGFALVSYAESELTEDGRHLLIAATTVEHGCVRLALRLADVQHFVTLMLQVVAQAAEAPPTECPDTATAALRQPIPLSAVEVGEFNDGAGFLTLTVGPTPLTFGGPAGSIARLGGMILAAGAPTDRRH